MSQQEQPKKSHKFRNFVVFPIVGFLAFIVVVSVASGGGQPPPQAPSVPAPVQPAVPVQPAAPVEEPAAEQPSHVEVGGDGEMMVMVMDGGGSSSNTVQGASRVDLQPGYVTVSVSRSPSVDDYMNSGGPSSGTVSCTLYRDGEVVDQQQAAGEFASVTCSKMY